MMTRVLGWQVISGLPTSHASADTHSLGLRNRISHRYRRPCITNVRCNVENIVSTFSLSDADTFYYLYKLYKLYKLYTNSLTAIKKLGSENGKKWLFKFIKVFTIYLYLRLFHRNTIHVLCQIMYKSINIKLHQLSHINN